MVRASIRRFFASPAIDGVVRLAVVLSLAGSAIAWFQTSQLAECLARYADDNNARSKIIAQAQDDERQAERVADDAQAALFLSPILTKPADERTAADQAEILRLFRAYQTALSEQKEERRSADDARRVHPIPDPPRNACG